MRGEERERVDWERVKGRKDESLERSKRKAEGEKKEKGGGGRRVESN